MGLYSGGLIIGRIFASEIGWAYFLFIYLFIIIIIIIIIIINININVFCGGGGYYWNFMVCADLCLILKSSGLKNQRKMLKRQSRISFTLDTLSTMLF